ncbi:MAG: efflux RND transporter periplasmic adaptor subunit [Aestuariibacter sp.]
MDIVIEKKTLNNKKKLIIVLAAVASLIPLFFLANYLLVLGQSEFSIERNKLSLDEVKRGHFKVSVRGTGVLVPADFQFLSSSVEAKVEKRHARAGDVVRKGDVLVELSNFQLTQQLEEALWELEVMEEEQIAATITRQTEFMQQEATMLEAKLEYESSINEYQARSELVKTGAVSKLDFQRAKVNMEQARQRWEFSQKRQKKLKENLDAQNKVQIAQLAQIRKRVERMRRQVDDLQVVATFDGIVLELPVEPGERLVMGANIAKLARQDSLIAELLVPEIQIRDVKPGQMVVIDTRNSKINGVVERVEPAVINGNVQVDIAFNEPLPDDARADLSVDGEIIVTEINDTLYVDRPLYAQSQSFSSVYRVNGSKNLAERVQVQLGYGSVNQIQILEGLSVGDVIVTSDPSRFQRFTSFLIK